MGTPIGARAVSGRMKVERMGSRTPRPPPTEPPPKLYIKALQEQITQLQKRQAENNACGSDESAQKEKEENVPVRAKLYSKVGGTHSQEVVLTVNGEIAALWCPYAWACDLAVCLQKERQDNQEKSQPFTFISVELYS